MDTPTSSTRDLAKRLLAASRTGSDPQVSDVAAVIQRLRISLSKFAGDAGFVSLLRRAVAMASADVPSLQNVRIGMNGLLDGVEQIGADPGTGVLGGGGGCGNYCASARPARGLYRCAPHGAVATRVMARHNSIIQESRG